MNGGCRFVLLAPVSYLDYPTPKIMGHGSKGCPLVGLIVDVFPN